MSKSRIVSLVAMAAAMAAVSAAYPVEVEVHNNHWRLAVEPETSTEIPGFGTAKVRVRDEAQMLRLLGNVDALRVMSSLPEGVGMSVHFPSFIPEAPVVEVEVKVESTGGDGDDAPKGDGSGQAPTVEAVVPPGGPGVANFVGTPEGGGEAAAAVLTGGDTPQGPAGDAPKDTAATADTPKADGPAGGSPDAAAAGMPTTVTATATPEATPKTKRR